MSNILVRKTSLMAAGFLFALFPTFQLEAQSPVQQFISNYVTAGASSSYSAFPTVPGTFSGCSGVNYTYTWSNGVSNQLKLNSFTANSKSYVIYNNATVEVKIRRVNNATVTGNRSILYSESTLLSALSCLVTGQLDFKAPYNADMAAFLNNNVLNHGTDNIFTNASNGDGNNNNIERVDVVFPSGIASSYPAEAGFILCERGNNNAHDGFRITPILSIDASNDPTSFGNVKTCVAGNGSNNGSWGHPSLLNGNKLLAAYVLRKDAAEPYLRVSSNVNQELGGVFFSLNDLNVNPGQVIYGYTLIGPDGIANPSSAQLLNINDASVYPTGTTEAQGGGLDLISINTFFGTNLALGSNGIISFSGSASFPFMKLNWELAGLDDNTEISFERSENAVSFKSIYQYRYQTGEAQQNFNDRTGTGSFYYRLAIRQPAGIVYSRVICLRSDTPEHWKLYPNLLTPGESVTLEGSYDGTYTAVLFGISGMVAEIPYTMSNGKALIQIPPYLSSGFYMIAPDRSKQNTRFKLILKKH